MADNTPTYTTFNSYLVRHKAGQDPKLKGKCALCKKPGTMVCKGCKDTPSPLDPILNTYYCSSTCQKEDWKIHKTLCKCFQARKALYRAGSILQETFYIYRKELFEKLIDRVERREGKIYLYEGKYGKVDHPMGLLHSFPSHLFENEEEQQAILVYLACDDAVGWMHELVKHMLAEICSDFEEVIVKVANPKRQIVAVGSPTADFDHQILKIKLKASSEEYILDLSSAQYGYHEPVVWFAHYLSSRVQALVGTVDGKPLKRGFGSCRNYLLEKYGTSLQDGPSHSHLPQILHIQGFAAKTLDKGAVRWEKDYGLTVGEMLRMAPDAFELHRKELIDTITTELVSTLEYARGKDAEWVDHPICDLAQLSLENNST